ncbi:MAG: aminotransferase class I/II-fold pyridoxal phosphate-dependent enzyme [Candidatus Fimousia sp.]|uniref:aminotransferase class I/II-fold pyridoxal phosphate-dependent enzyme n=1 Tax=Anaerostipes sp. 992a TaxID=1261637 RepID=UPI00095367DC|nr:aminotransferase class I/II-fold pyridoxal phosphate-dependent enzyme [Anaerostipes sp. 992a]MDD5968500.1 aminotransferase class I/II-fold pyridoxal phosphate-dependent enzyme [Anaerostipes sp.]OLR63840.1 aminotransferase [Anaerostipes sp. 992a]
MAKITEYSKEQLEQLQKELLAQYDEYVKSGLKLDMSRGKPAPSQLDLSNGMLDALEDYTTENGLDARNYGVLDGIPEMKKIFSDAFDIPASQIIVGGNASLNLMFDAVMRLMVFGTEGNTPWGKLDTVKFLCPSPGYDRHFGICERLGIEMIVVPMTESGPDMDVIESLVAEDESIKGIWCVPKYSNPQGICYSDETVKRLAAMKTAAKDFRIFWDNAYGVHPIFEDVKVLNILDEAKAAGNPNRPLYFASTSKITFPGAGVSFVAASEEMVAEIKGVTTYQTIGYDKLNQLRHVRFFKDAEGLKAHMQKLADAMKPKFQIVLSTLEKELEGTGLLSWSSPKGGYFVSVDTLEGCAKETVRLVKEAGVVMTGAGATYPYKKDPKDTNIRIAPTYPSVEELTKAMEIFCVCVKLAGVQKLLAE